ncbi:hypothetical protein MDN67_002415 [Listeria monocytogenes]|nr:hypothetical protein [Listeria monocytogenes]
MNQKVYIVIDYDDNDNDRVLLINVDKNMCLKVIKNIIEIDIELGEIDCDIDTILHERGEEIYDLPRGTRVIPHSLSTAMMERAGRDYAKNISNMNDKSFSQTISIANFNNNSRQDISSLMEDLSNEAKKKNAWRN